MGEVEIYTATANLGLAAGTCVDNHLFRVFSEICTQHAARKPAPPDKSISVRLKYKTACPRMLLVAQQSTGFFKFDVTI